MTTRLLAALPIFAVIIPLFVNPFESFEPVVGIMSDGIVQTRLAATATFTGAALIWLAILGLRGHFKSFNWPSVLQVAVVTFVVVNVLALVFAEDWRASIIGERLRYQGLGATLLYVLLFAVSAYAVRTLGDLRTVLVGLFIAGVIAAAYALVQKFGLDWIDWADREPGRPSSTIRQLNTFAAFLVLAINASVALLPAEGRRWRSAGPWFGALALGWAGAGVLVLLGVSTGVGAILAIVFTIVFAELVFAFSGIRALRDVAVFAGMTAMAAALLFTISRAGYLAMFVSLMIWGVAAVAWFLHVRRGRAASPLRVAWIAAGALALAAFVVVMIPLSVKGLGEAGVDLGRYGERIEDTTDFDTYEIASRRALWSLAWEMTLDRPLLGSGHDSFSIKFPQYRDRPDLPGIGTDAIDPESAHNVFLDLSTGTGLLGLLAFLLLIGVVFSIGGKRLLSEQDGRVQIALLSLLSACTAYLVAVTLGFMEATTTWALWLLLGTIAGLACPVPERQKAGENEPRSVMSMAVPFALGALGVVALVWAASFTAANLAAGQAVAALEDNNSEAGLRLARRAVRLDPLERAYLVEKGDAYVQSSSTLGVEEAYRRGMETYRTALTRFAPESGAALQFAVARQALLLSQGQPLDEVWPDFEYAVSLDPFDACLRLFVAENYIAQGEEERAFVHQEAIRSFAAEARLPLCVYLG